MRSVLFKPPSDHPQFWKIRVKIVLKNWLMPASTVVALSLITGFSPKEPLDPWGLFSLQKISTMILALTVIQATGFIMAQNFRSRTKALLTGFVGGIISSTATTASLARASKNNSDTHASTEILTFLSATGAMLFQGLALVIIGVSDIHLGNLLVFIGPILATFVMILTRYKKSNASNETHTEAKFLILNVLKLAALIAVILLVSKIFQNIFGQSGVVVITLLVSLFDIHGSVIANVQLHEFREVSVHLLSSLLAISIFSSYVSKLFLIWTLGSRVLRTQAIRSTIYLFISLAASWAVAVGIA